MVHAIGRLARKKVHNRHALVFRDRHELRLRTPVATDNRYTRGMNAFGNRKLAFDRNVLESFETNVVPARQTLRLRSRLVHFDGVAIGIRFIDLIDPGVFHKPRIGIDRIGVIDGDDVIIRVLNIESTTRLPIGER